MRLLLGLLTILLSCGLLVAEIGPTPGTQAIRPAFDNADVVCNCKVESLRVVSEEQRERGGKTVRHRWVIASVMIKDTYKSSLPLGEQLSVEFEEESPVVAIGPALFKDEAPLLFLKKNTASVYAIADRYVGATPFSAIPLVPGALGIQKLQSALTAILKVGNRDDQINALRLLEGMDELAPETLTQADSLSSSPDAEVALSAIAMHLKGKSAFAVDKLTQFLSTYSDSRTPIALLSIGAELGKIFDPKQLAKLEELSSSKYLSIKFGAMDAIRRIGDRRSAPALIQRLSDTDNNVRYQAVRTLAEIFGKTGDYAPPLYQFDRNPDFYVRLWKTWWADEGQLTSR